MHFIHVYNILWSHLPTNPPDQLVEGENTWHGFADECAPHVGSDQLSPHPLRVTLRDSNERQLVLGQKAGECISLQLGLCHELARNSDLQGFMKCCWMIRALRRSWIRSWKWVTWENGKRQKAELSGHQEKTLVSHVNARSFRYKNTACRGGFNSQVDEMTPQGYLPTPFPSHCNVCLVDLWAEGPIVVASQRLCTSSPSWTP